MTVFTGSWACSSSSGEEEFQEEIQEQGEFENNQDAAFNQEDEGQQQEVTEDFEDEMGNVAQQFENEQSENFTQQQLANLSEEELAELEAEVQSLQSMASNDAGQDDLQGILNDVNQEGNDFATQNQNQDNLFANQNQENLGGNDLANDQGFSEGNVQDEGFVGLDGDIGSDAANEQGNDFVSLGDEGTDTGDNFNSFDAGNDVGDNYVDLTGATSQPTKRRYTPRRSSWTYSYEQAPSVNGTLPEMGTQMPYIVERGDTLSVIARRVYGNMGRWQELAQASGVEDVNRIFPGDIVYYTLDQQSAGFAAAYESRGMSMYTVQAGEDLRSIAQKIYGTGQAWKILWRYNDMIQNPDSLQAGSTIYYAAPQKLTASLDLGLKNHVWASLKAIALTVFKA